MLIAERNILFSSRRPYKYEVEYLESSGTQYIDTGYIPTPATETEAKVMPTDQTTSRFVFGCRQAQSKNTYACLLHSSSRIGYRVGTGSFVYVSGYSEVDAIHKYGIANGVFYRDGVVVSNACIGASFSTSSTLALLAINTNGTYDQKFVGRLYSCNIKNNSELVRDFIPVVDWNDRPAMYDKVTNKLFYNAGTGEFGIGRKIIPIEYLESTGTQYIDTGMILSSTGFAYNADVMFSSVENSQVFGGRTQANFGSIDSLVLFLVNATWRFDYFGNSKSGSFVVKANTRYAVSYANGVTSVNGVSFSTPIVSGRQTGATVYIFAGHRPTAVNEVEYNAKMRLYNLKFYQDVLVRDFIPAKDENGVGFMFDKVNRVIYDNAGKGAFITGAEI